MCGIAAIFSPQAPVTAEVLELATTALRHRGPDDHQIWLSPGGLVGLGHRRLSIIDLETGRQPLANEDGAIRAVVNGEFYGYQAIREDLERRGHHFRSLSDSEILVHLYEEHGLDLFPWLRGEFAFLLWDQNERRLVAGRDRFGMKPLFYAEHAGGLYFASEAKALFAVGVPARWDEETAFQHFFFYAHLDRTLFAGVRQLRPGHYLVANRANIRIARYWDLDYPPAAEAARDSDETCVETVRSKLAEAVDLRLQADVPVSSFLSGGVDSSAVLGFAARRATGSSIRAFTVQFAEEGFDETGIARETAAHLGSPFQVVRAGPAEIAAHLEAAVWHAETIGVNWHGVARYLLCRDIRDAGYKVALTGEGADELFAGYVQFRQDATLDQPAALPANLGPIRSRLGFVPAWFRKLAVNRSIFHILLHREFCASFSARNPYCEFLSQLDVEGQLKGRHRLHQSLYLWIRSILPNYTLFAERLEMAHAVETRMPFLDHPLFELVRGAPVSMLLRSGQEKYLLRVAAKPVLTDTVFRRAKHPFFAPLAGKGSNPLQTLVQDTLRGNALRLIPFFDRDAIIQLLDRFPSLDESTRSTLDSTILMVVSAAILHDKFRLGSV